MIASIDDLGNLTLLERNAAGRVTRQTLPDPDGSGPLSSFVTEYTYDTLNNLTGTTHPDSTTESWTYNSLNLPLTHTDRLGRLTVYTYDAAGNRTSERRVFGEIDDEINLETDDLVTTMTYTPGGAGQPPKGLLASVTDPLGRGTSYTYNTKGLVTSITYAVGTAIQASVQYVYNATTDLLTQSIDELGRTTDYAYDSLGRLTLTTLPDPDGVGPLPRPTIAQVWNGNGRMTSETDPLGRVTSYTYAHHGRVTSMTRPDHDLSGQLTVTEYDFDAAHRPTTTTDPLGRVTTTNYNTLGWVTSTVLPDPDGPGGPIASPTTTYTYDNMGRMLTETDPLGNVTTYTYANFGREATITLPDPDGTAGPLASPVLFREYDAAGNLVLERGPLGAETTYVYDAANRLVTVTAPDPDASGELEAPVTTYQYDKAGNLVSTTDPLGNVTAYTYDARNRRTHEILADPDAGGPLTSPTTVYAYNAANELTSLTDPVNNTTTWQYDGLGRVKLETNQLNKTRTFEYDAAGNLTKRIDRLGRILQFEYDTLNHLTAEKWYDGTTLVRTLSFSYDAADQLLSVTDPAAVFSYGYDGLGRLTNEGQTITGLTPQLNFASQYSANSQRTQLQAARRRRRFQEHLAVRQSLPPHQPPAARHGRRQRRRRQAGRFQLRCRQPVHQGLALRRPRRIPARRVQPLRARPLGPDDEADAQHRLSPSPSGRGLG
ncbi:MAG: hypothetical protein L0211_12735 [Planctomycetaceae bacterium]|nr:hypothetical protein [Planctomycetaceae bacterium]